MRKSFALAIACLLIFPIIAFNQASGQLIEDTSDLEAMTTVTGQASNLGQVEIGQMAAVGIRVILGFLAIIFLVLTLISGFKWMTAGGNQDQIKQAQGTLKSAVIGLIIVLSAYTITYFVFTELPFSAGGGDGVTVSNPQ